MPTLWEMLKKKVSGEEEEQEEPLELQFHNPLQLEIAHTVKLDVIDTDGVDLGPLNFDVRQIREVKRVIGDQTFFFVDYDLLGRSLAGDEIRKRLRLIPMENPDAETTHDVLLLNRFDEFAYHEEFVKGLAFDQNNGEFYEQEFEATYWRPEGVEEPWDARTAYIRDADSDGKVEEDEIRIGTLRYWDFGRDTEDDGGNTITEWYMVEMDENGYLEIWIGAEINPTRISV